MSFTLVPLQQQIERVSLVVDGYAICIFFIKFDAQRIIFTVRAVVVAQLVERSLPIPEISGSTPVIGKFLYTTNCIKNLL